MIDSLRPYNSAGQCSLLEGGREGGEKREGEREEEKKRIEGKKEKRLKPAL